MVHKLWQRKKGLQALLKRVSPNVQWTHCIHREELALRQINPELNTVLTDVVAIMVNFIKKRPLKA